MTFLARVSVGDLNGLGLVLDKYKPPHVQRQLSDGNSKCLMRNCQLRLELLCSHYTCLPTALLMISDASASSLL